MSMPLKDEMRNKMDTHYREIKMILNHITKSIDEIKDEMKEIKREVQSNREKLLSYQTIISFMTKWGAGLMTLGGVLYAIKKYLPT